MSLWVASGDVSQSQVSNAPVEGKAQTDHKQAEGIQAPALTEGKQQGAAKNQERCDDPEAYNGPDLCAQWVAANAARKSAELAQSSLFWSVLSFFALLLTLLATAWAAWAAARAARTADRSTALNEATAERQLRAYIGLDRAYLTQFEVGQTVQGEAIFKNYGSTPATDCDIKTYCGHIFLEEGFLPDSDEDNSINHNPTVVWPGSEHHVKFQLDGTLDGNEKAAFEFGDLCIALRSNIDYVDAFGNKRLTKVHLYCTRGSMTFLFAPNGNSSS